MDLNYTLNKIARYLLDNANVERQPTMDENLGTILFLANLYTCTKQDLYKKKSLEILEMCIESFSNYELKSGIHEGFDGFGYLVGQLDNLGLLESQEILKDFVPYLEQSLKADFSINNFDILYGSMGKLQFFIHYPHISNLKKESLVDDFIQKLYDNRIEDKDGIYWHENSKKFSVNLGFAHGIPSILLFLSYLYKSGFKNSHLTFLIDGLQRKILSLENPVPGLSSFGQGFVQDKIANSYTRLAWCYGDLGIIYSLLYSGSICNQTQIQKKCSAYLEIVLSRDLTTSGIIHFQEASCFDPGFCHGIAGIGYILDRINDLYPHKKTKLRIDYWNDELLSNIEKVLNSSTIYYPDFNLSGKKIEVYDKCNFLNGLSGAGLALLSTRYAIRDWSQFFLIY